MVMMLGEVVTRYSADVSGYSKGMATMESETATTGAKMSAGLAIAGLAIAATAIAIGAVTVKMASDFQTGITTLETGAGESAKNLGMVADGIKRVSVDTGTMTGPLIAGMFQIESAGFRGAAGLNVLEVAAKGAKVGNADLGVTADAVTTVMKDYGMGANRAGDAMNFLTAIVQNGKTHLQELAASMSQVLPTASAVGVHLVDVGAAMATMTGEGVHADQAATFLRQTLISLAAPAHAGAASLKAIGLSAQEVSDGMKKSLPDTLKLIMTHLAETYKVGSPEYVTALKNIAGGSRQMQGMLDLTGTHLKDFQANMKNVSGVMNENKNSVAGWAAVQSDLSLQVDRGKAALAVLAITIGSALIPVITRIVAAITPVIVGFTNWLVQNHMLMPVLAALGIVIGVILVAALVAVAVAAWTALAPFALIALAVVAAVAIIVLAITHWGQIVTWLKNVWATISGFFVGLWNGIIAFLTNVWNTIKSVATIVFLAIVAVILGPFLPLFLFIRANWTAISNFLRGLWIIIQAGAQVIWAAITAFIATEVRGAQIIITAVWNAISPFVIGVWNFIKGVATAVWGFITLVISTDVNAARAVVTAVWGAISSFLSGIWNTIRSVASSVWNSITSVISNAWHTILGIIQSVGGQILSALISPFQSAYNTIAGIVGGIANFVGGILSKIASIGGAANGIKVPGAQSGIGGWKGGPLWVGEAGRELIWLPKGSGVSDHADSEQIASGGYASSGHGSTTYVPAGGGGGARTYILQVDGREMAQALGSHFASEIRLQLGLRG